MSEKITQAQFDKMETARCTDPAEFIGLLALYTGIEARACIAYQYFVGGDFVGDDWDSNLSEILRAAEIEVEENGK